MSLKNLIDTYLVLELWKISLTEQERFSLLLKYRFGGVGGGAFRFYFYNYLFVFVCLFKTGVSSSTEKGWT